MKTLITLNIGLLDADGQNVNVHTAIFHLLSILKIDILASRVGKGKWEGKKEPVLVVSAHVIFDESFENKLVELAQSLRQSCIAVRFLDGTGKLYPAIFPFDASLFVPLEKHGGRFTVEYSSDDETWLPLSWFYDRQSAENEIKKLKNKFTYFFRIVEP